MRIYTAIALLLLLPAAAVAQNLDTALSAVVRISGTRNGAGVQGSGFVVGLDRDKATIVTASHVIEGVQQIEVVFAADLTESFRAEKVLGMDSGNPRGLAVFQVRSTLPEGVTPLSFETTAGLQRGEEVFVLGFPEMAATPLAFRMSFAGPVGNLLQLDRPAGEGASGGPVVRRGKVVGVVTAEDLRLTYAVKATVAQDTVLGWGGRFGRPTVGPTALETAKACVSGEEERTPSGIVLVRICPGTFTMGSAKNDKSAFEDEKPAHRVTLREFWIAKTETTNAQYRRFRPSHQGENELPAINLSWKDAQEACQHFGGRLPTEAEWEYAARAGSWTAWSFGDDEKLLAKHAWYDANAGGKVHPVGKKTPNRWKLYDMHGNVLEWVADLYGPYQATEQSNPAGPATGEYRVLRGGAFFFSPTNQRSAIRENSKPESYSSFFGFRCARSPRRQS